MPVRKSSPGEFKPETVSEHDILFDCPECKKLLVVDDRAAGLKIDCPECGKPVSVPEQAHATRAVEHHDAATAEEKRQVLERQVEENRMQHAEATNKFHDHVTQANRFKLRIQKLEQEHAKMQEELKKLSK
jgi:DNA-directed RNA polymerase subunit M/transcription elongation factor TFIIS